MRFEIDTIPIVVVDGDELSRHVMVRRLLRWGYDPVAFARPTDALAHLRQFAARALLCDLHTARAVGAEPAAAGCAAGAPAAGAAGAEELELVRAARIAQPDLPVFLVTANPTAEQWAQAAHAGARDLLAKQAGSAEALRRALAVALSDDLDDRDDVRLAHELRTPLTALKNAIDILCSDSAGPLPAEQRRFAGIAQRNVDKMIALVEELLESAARP
jgi:CheY-like chemotaxis protein